MSLLTVAPYDPWHQTAWVGDLIKLSAQLREEKAKRDQQTSQQALQDQRRAFEFDRRLEFERARTAADDTRADSRLGMERQTFDDNRAPFSLPAGSQNQPAPTLPTNSDTTSSPSSSLPTLNVSDTPAAGADTSIPAQPDPFAEDGTADIPATPPTLPAPPATAATNGEDQFEIDPVSGTPKLVKSPANAVAPAKPSSSLPTLAGTPRANDVAASTLFPSGGVSGGAVTAAPAASVTAAPSPTTTTAGSHVAALARDLAATGLWNRPGGAKQANQILTQAAASEGSRKAEAAAGSKAPVVRNFSDGTTRQYDTGTSSWVTLSSKPAGAEAETLQDAVGTATYNKDHGTYVRDDGSEFFPQRSANGKWMQRPFMPSQKPAKILWGDDGNVYPVDAQGNFLKPKPDGVQLRDHAQLQTVDVAGVGRMIVNPDQSTRLLIPEGIPLTGKKKDKYTEDVQALRAAQVDLDAQTKLKNENPSKVGVTWFGGGTQAAVDEAKKKFDAAKTQVDGWHKDFPQLAAKNMPSTTQNTGGIPKVATQAEYDALPAGADYFDPQGRRSRKRAPVAPAAPGAVPAGGVP